MKLQEKTTQDELVEKADQEEIQGLILSQPENWTPESLVFYGPDKRSILLQGEIESDIAGPIISQLLTLEEESDDPVSIHINSPGGSLTDMWAIYDTMRHISCPIYTVGLGMVGSAALLLFCGGDMRISTPNTTFFYHEPIISTSVLQGVAMANTAEVYEAEKEKMNRILRGRSHIPKKIWYEKFRGSTGHYFSAETALTYGIVDKIALPANKNKLTNKRWIKKNGKSR